MKTKQDLAKDLESTLPFLNLTDLDIFEVRPHFFSKTYPLPDINFEVLETAKQAEIGIRWAKFLGSFDNTTSVQISGYKQTVNMMDFRENTLIKKANDDLNFYRDEYNDNLLNILEEETNNLIINLMLTITIPAVGILEAQEKFKDIDKTVNNEMSNIVGEDIKPMTTDERINMLYSIYNPEDEVPLVRPMMENGEEKPSFSFDKCKLQGVAPETIIGPDSLHFKHSYFEMGSMVGKTLYAALYPSNLQSTTISSFLNLPANMLFSCHLRTYETSEGIKFLKNKNKDIDANLLEKQEKAWAKGHDPSLVNPELSQAKDETLEMIDELTKNDGKLFLANITVTIFAPSLEKLKSLESSLKRTASNKDFVLKGCNAFQKIGFNTSMPIGKCEMPESTERLLTTTSVISLIPFNVKRVNDKDGTMNGQNAISKELIIVDRKNYLNSHMMILGPSGSGKSFSAKEEISNTIFADVNDDVLVLDPKGEYSTLADNYKGSVVKISPGSKNFINPFDLVLNSGDSETDPVKMKADFVESMVELMLDSKWGLSPGQRSIIGRCTTNIYEDYKKYCNTMGISFDREKCPTLKDFYNELKRQRDPEAKDLVSALEKFVKTQDVFAHHTNVDVDNRFVVFNIKYIGKGLKNLGIYILMEHIYNRTLENGEKGKWTWIYIDEFHSILDRAGGYVSQMWRLFRQYMGLATGITQNVEDMLSSEAGRNIINSSHFVRLMSQAPSEQGIVQKIFNIPNEEMQYITSGKPGCGILQIGKDLIPFANDFPRETQLYKIMSTKPKEN